MGETTRKVRITNPTGNPLDTRVVDHETGEHIARCFKALITCSIDDVPRAELHIYMPILDVVAEATIVEHEVGKGGEVTGAGDGWRTYNTGK